MPEFLRKCSTNPGLILALGFLLILKTDYNLISTLAMGIGIMLYVNMVGWGIEYVQDRWDPDFFEGAYRLAGIVIAFVGSLLFDLDSFAFWKWAIIVLVTTVAAFGAACFWEEAFVRTITKITLYFTVAALAYLWIPFHLSVATYGSLAITLLYLGLTIKRFTDWVIDYDVDSFLALVRPTSLMVGFGMMTKNLYLGTEWAWTPFAGALVVVFLTFAIESILDDPVGWDPIWRLAGRTIKGLVVTAFTSYLVSSILKEAFRAPMLLAVSVAAVLGITLGLIAFFHKGKVTT